MKTFASLGLFAVLALQGCDDAPLSLPGGACSAANRKSADDDYDRLALGMVVQRIGFGIGVMYATQDAVDQQIKTVSDQRQWALGVADACLREHVTHWLDFYDRQARQALRDRAEFDSRSAQYDQERQDENARVEALSKTLGVNP